MAGSGERRLRRELKTVGAMITIFCRGRHGRKDGLCEDCAELLAYAKRRVARCPQLPDKPACARCQRHCYAPPMRERIREVMRYSGPRMLWRHPLAALLHLLDGGRTRPRHS